MPGPFDVQTQRNGNTVVIAVNGELDLASGPELETELSALGPPDTALVVVDLRQLDFMDSTGLSIIVKAHRRLADAGAELGLVRGPAQVQRLLDLTGVAERLRVAASPEELVAES